MKLLKMIHTSFLVPVPYAHPSNARLGPEVNVAIPPQKKGLWQVISIPGFGRRNVMFTLMISSPLQADSPWVYLASNSYIQ